MSARLRTLIAALAPRVDADPAAFDPFLDGLDAGDRDLRFDLLWPHTTTPALGLNRFDRDGAGDLPARIGPWTATHLGDPAAAWLPAGLAALRGLRLHGGPAVAAGAWRLKLYASGTAPDVAAAWDRLHRDHGLGAPAPPAGTYALGIDLTTRGPARLRAYLRPDPRDPDPHLTRLAGLGLGALPRPGVSHLVLAVTAPGPADPDTRPKESLAWIHRPGAPTEALLALADAIAARTGAAPPVPAADLAPHPWLRPVALELDATDGEDLATDALFTAAPAAG